LPGTIEAYEVNISNAQSFRKLVFWRAKLNHFAARSAKIVCSSAVGALFERAAHRRAISRIFLGSILIAHFLARREPQMLAITVAWLNPLNGDELVCVFRNEGPSPS
jgi:hypothetical protein